MNKKKSKELKIMERGTEKGEEYRGVKIHQMKYSLRCFDPLSPFSEM